MEKEMVRTIEMVMRGRLVSVSCVLADRVFRLTGILAIVWEVSSVWLQD